MKITPLESWILGKVGNTEQHLSRHMIGAYQLDRLQETVKWARTHSPFYKEHLARCHEGMISSLADLARLPFTTPEDLRQNPLQLLCVSQGEISRVVTLPTSGTMGEPKRIYFTPEDQELTVDFFCCGMSTFTGSGDRVLIVLPGERPGSVGDLLEKGLDRLGAVGIQHGPVKDVRNTMHVMVREKVDGLVGIPVQVLALARHWPGNGMGLPPRNVLLSTDYVPDAITRELRRIWGCQVFAHYGMTEMGYGGGVECHAHFGYHMREADLFFEIIDPETGNPMEDGKSGEVVFTTLTRRGMPLIRYRTGDISRFRPVQCPCGTALKTMEPVGSRISGQLELEPGIILTMADLDEALFRIHDLVDFSAELKWEHDRNLLQITAALLEGSGGQTENIFSAVKAIPILRPSIQQGRLKVRIMIIEESTGLLDGHIKRTIVDMRAEERHHGHF